MGHVRDRLPSRRCRDHSPRADVLVLPGPSERTGRDPVAGVERWIGRQIPGLGFLSMLVIILLVGICRAIWSGRVLFSWFENLLQSIPFVRSVYGAIKDLVNAFNIGGTSKTFRQVVMVEYPRKGLYCIGFVTNEMAFTAHQRADDRISECVYPQSAQPDVRFSRPRPRRRSNPAEPQH